MKPNWPNIAVEVAYRDLSGTEEHATKRPPMGTEAAAIHTGVTLSVFDVVRLARARTSSRGSFWQLGSRWYDRSMAATRMLEGIVGASISGSGEALSILREE